jgi:hypothetical protein
MSAPADGGSSSNAPKNDDVSKTPKAEGKRERSSLGGDRLSKDLGEIEKRFSDWFDKGWHKKGTEATSDSDDFRLRSSKDRFNLGPDVGKAHEFFDVVKAVMEGRFNDISDEGLEKFELVLDTIREVFEAAYSEPGELSGARAGESFAEFVNEAVYGETSQQQLDRLVGEIEKRQEFVSKQLELNRDWWRSENTVLKDSPL